MENLIFFVGAAYISTGGGLFLFHQSLVVICSDCICFNHRMAIRPTLSCERRFGQKEAVHKVLVVLPYFTWSFCQWYYFPSTPYTCWISRGQPPATREHFDISRVLPVVWHQFRKGFHSCCHWGTIALLWFWTYSPLVPPGRTMTDLSKNGMTTDFISTTLSPQLTYHLLDRKTWTFLLEQLPTTRYT